MSDELDIEAIKKRWANLESRHVDIPALIVEVERLKSVRDKLANHAFNLFSVLDWWGHASRTAYPGNDEKVKAAMGFISQEFDNVFNCSCGWTGILPDNISACQQCGYTAKQIGLKAKHVL